MMPKRPPPIQCFKLREDMTLRVRSSDMNVDGSVILIQAGRLLECVHYMEATDMENTEEGWFDRYVAMYGADVEGLTREEIIRENEDARKFSERLGVCSLSSGKLMQPAAPKLVEFDGAVMKLKMEIDVPSSKWTIGHVMHVSMRLTFAEFS